MEKLLLKLKDLNIDIKLEGDNLKLSFPKNFNSGDILEELKVRKNEIISYIKLKSAYVHINNNIPKVEKRKYYVLSAPQERLYFLYELSKNSTTYNVFQSVILYGELDKDKIENTFFKLIQRHESLRTNFVIEEDRPVQIIADSLDFQLEYFSSESGISLIMDKFVRPFDLETDPLIRVGLISVGPTEHILVVDMHHIITDGVSRGILIRDFMSFYNDEDLPALQVQYKDYAEWQKNEEQQKVVLAQKGFWLEEFSELPTVLEMPYDFIRPKLKSNEGSSLSFEIGEEMTRGLRGIAESEKTTMFMIMFSIYTILLSRLGNQEDIVVGVPVSGRYHADMDGIIGMFVNTLPLRNYPEGQKIYSEYLHELEKRTLSGFENQAYPYESLLDELKVVRNVSRNPLFDVVFSYENFEEINLEIPGLKLKNYPLNQSEAKFDLTVRITELDNKFYLNIDYSTALFTAGTIEKYAGYFMKIASEIIADRRKQLLEIDILSEEEKYALLTTFNDTSMAYPTDKTVIDLFEERAEKIPDNLAIVFEDESCTYAMLNQRADAIAAEINQALEGKKGQHIGLLFNPSIEIIVAILGVLKSGNSYIPLTLDLPINRISYILNDCDSKLLIVHQDILENNNELKFLDQKVQILKCSGAYLEPVLLGGGKRNIDGDSLLYTIYTSGTTGTPKGVEIRNRGLVNMLSFYTELFKVNEGLKFGQSANLCFDAAEWEIWPSLVLGGTLYIAPNYLRYDAESIKEWIVRNNIEISFQPTVMAELLLQMDWSKENCALKVLNVAGDQLNFSMTKELPFQVYNLYGPTEDSIWTTYREMKVSQNDDYYNIGKPIANKNIYILNKHHKLQPLGTVGELCIGGVGLAKGYVKNELETNNKFVIWEEFDPERIYKTGDLARWNKEGNIEFFGRIDSQVKIRGYRIELEEIRSCLQKYHQVMEVAVIAREINQINSLLAYYVSKTEIEQSVLRDFLLEQLPAYMIPPYFIHLEQLPITANGKLDKNALPEPDLFSASGFVSPSNDVQEKILEIWAEVLKINKDDVSVNSNFFEIGGNSLNMVSIIKRLNNIFGSSISIVQMFQLPSIASIAEFIANKDTTANDPRVEIDQAVDEANETLRILEDFE
ncbi:amino acid adenylation domain-containing protein [Pedobacter sp. MR22-3]|uniref:non-ribosomal peptide synthetase n=1 Tax=Pedobacter TaxID=84567 RepID=UPI002246AD4A|nr:amino acid adenylation domain-containing protein [Pedobacter sp. MR22-3]MCX2584719.1 amino acid adenylation domain-containing protein [Pedobacter sp. MR22-3]